MSRSKQDGRSQTEDKPEVHVVEIVRHGEKLVLPPDMTAEQAIGVLERVRQQEEEILRMSERVLVFPFDGARALKKAITETFGVALQNSDFFGARQIGVESDVGEVTQVPWGSFTLPGIDGEVGCSVDEYEGRLVFRVYASVKRKHEAAVKRLINLTREIAQRESLYRSRAIQVKFRDARGNIDQNAQPKFMDLRNVEPAIFSADLQREIDTNIMALILYPKEVRAAGTPLKRGVLLGGRYGVGKTLLAANIAKVCTQNGWTFLYVSDPAELPDAILFAIQYQPCVIFVEDVDRVTSGPRDEEIDQILNHLDGINTKGAEIITIMSTNDVGAINAAMLRPGRVDVPLFIDPPDAEAVAQLVRMYGRDFIAEDEDLTEVGAVLEGRIPAVIREVVERSKLNTISRTKGQGDKVRAVDIVDAARTYLKAEQRLRPVENDNPSSAMEAFGAGFGRVFSTTLAEFLQNPPAELTLPTHTNGHTNRLEAGAISR